MRYNTQGKGKDMINPILARKIIKGQVEKIFNFEGHKIPIKFVWDYVMGDFYYVVAPDSYMKVLADDEMKVRKGKYREVVQHITYFIPEDKFNLKPLALSKYVSNLM